jgi:hypothetical protein
MELSNKKCTGILFSMTVANLLFNQNKLSMGLSENETKHIPGNVRKSSTARTRCVS